MTYLRAAARPANLYSTGIERQERRLKTSIFLILRDVVRELLLLLGHLLSNILPLRGLSLQLQHRCRELQHLVLRLAALDFPSGQ